MKWSDGAGYNKVLKHAHQYSMTKCCYWTLILRDALLRRKKDLVGCLVELKVMVSHSREAEVIIPERNHHLQNKWSLIRKFLFMISILLTNPRSYLLLLVWVECWSDHQWISVDYLDNHCFSFLLFGSEDGLLFHSYPSRLSSWNVLCFIFIVFFFILDVKWD